MRGPHKILKRSSSLTVTQVEITTEDYLKFFFLVFCSFSLLLSCSTVLVRDKNLQGPFAAEEEKQILRPLSVLKKKKKTLSRDLLFYRILRNYNVVYEFYFPKKKKKPAPKM